MNHPFTILLCLIATQSVAANIECTLTATTCAVACPKTHINFSIDHSQFVAPQDSNDPPRRQITQVTLDSRTFQAEAIAWDTGIVGFYHDVGPNNQTLMIAQENGAARLSRQPQGEILTGTCTRR